jgi:hypothetical protein
MSLGKALGKLLLFSVLQVGAYMGVHMRPDDIEKLLEVMNRTRVVHIMKREGSDPPNGVADPPDE